MKKILGILFCFTLVFCLHSNVSATTYKGSLTAGDGTLLYPDKWSDAFLSWTVDDVTNKGLWTYVYTFSAEKPELSHAIIEVSLNFTFDNIISANVNDKAVSINDFFKEGEPKPYGNQGNSNPGIPGSIYGLKWEFNDQGSTVTFTLVSDKDPMWGNFYAKGGQEYAYNSGFGIDTSAPIGDGNALDRSNELSPAWVLVPDTGAPVPEPATMFLLGSGLIGMGVFVRRKFKR